MPNKPQEGRLAARVCKVALGFLCGASTIAQAQAVDPDHRGASVVARDCRDTLIAANLSRLTVYQQAVVHDTARAILAQVDLLSWRIAQGVRASLGAHGAAVPAGDSLGKWPLPIRHLPLDIIVRRDGPGAWRLGAPADSDAAPATLTAFYERVMRTIPPDSIWMAWPDGYAPDSLMFRLDLVAYGQADRVVPNNTSLMALFSTTGVAERPALDKHPLYAIYPEDARQNRIVGTVVLEFVVDTTGRADEQTIRVLRPTEAQLDSSAYAHYLREFIKATRYAIERHRFTPAHIGRCPVRERVQFPASYALRHN